MAKTREELKNTLWNNPSELTARELEAFVFGRNTKDTIQALRSGLVSEQTIANAKKMYYDFNDAVQDQLDTM